MPGRVLALCTLIVLMVIPACSGGGTNSGTQPGLGTSAELPAGPQAAGPGPDLNALLMAEFDRLGIDPGRKTSTVPIGKHSAVLDLSTEKVDPDGDGPEPPNTIRLTWTEQFTGDYDLNGQVGLSDLTPLGIHLGGKVTYLDDSNSDAPWHPAGDPADGDTGAMNWRLARIDGNHDGEVNIADITTLVEHWKERIDGYIVYRRDPGTTKFAPVKGNEEHRAPGFVPRLKSTPGQPVRYAFTDYGLPMGNYVYYVVPVDLSDGTYGEPSRQVPARLLNTSPVAFLDADITSGNAPLTVAFDASRSTDPDGEIIEYEWDLDGDGNFNETDNGEDTFLGQANVGYTYNESGDHQPAVRVTDDRGDMDINTEKVHVNHAPVAVLKAAEYEGNQPFSTLLDARDSYDPDGEIVNYKWDLDGDGVFNEEDNLEAESEGSYQTNISPEGYGEIVVGVLVTDDHGVVSNATVTLKINGQPYAEIHTSSSTFVNQTQYSFTAKSAIDPENDNISYTWKVIGSDDEFMLVGSNNNTSFSYTFEESGQYTVLLAVIDEKQAVYVTSYPIYVMGRPVVVLVNEDYYKIQVGDSITFDGTGSYDPDSESFLINWNVDGVLVHSSNELTYEHTFNDACDSTITAWAIDPDGNISHKAGQFTVNAYKWNRYLLPEVPDGYSHNFIGSYSVDDTRPAVIYTDGSKTCFSYIAADEQCSDWLGPNLIFSDGELTSSNTFMVSVDYIDGNPAVALGVRHLSPDLKDKVYFIKSSNTDGSIWEEPDLLYTAANSYVTIGNIRLENDINGNPAIAFYEREYLSSYGKYSHRVKYIPAAAPNAESWSEYSNAFLETSNSSGFMKLVDILSIETLPTIISDRKYIQATTPECTAWFTHSLDYAINQSVTAPGYLPLVWQKVTDSCKFRRALTAQGDQWEECSSLTSIYTPVSTLHQGLPALVLNETRECYSYISASNYDGTSLNWNSPERILFNNRDNWDNITVYGFCEGLSNPGIFYSDRYGWYFSTP